MQHKVKKIIPRLQLISDDQLPYNYIRFKTYPDKWRSVQFSVNKIGKNDPPGPKLGNVCDGTLDGFDDECTLES